MPSALTWSVESVLLGLWAVVFSSYSTPLHVFVARSHVLISTFTMVLHLAVVSRGYVVGSAVSQAFLCAVSALFLTYLLAVFADSDDARLFRMPGVGLLKLDAVIGLAWFAAVLLSSLGMALSGISQQSGSRNEKKTLLMLHPLGSHVMVISPCLTILKIANSATSMLSWVFVCMWCAYVINTTVFVLGTHFQSLLRQLEKFKSWPWYAAPIRVLADTLHLFRFSMLVIPIIVSVMVDMSTSQRAVIFCLVGVAALSSLNALAALALEFLLRLSGRKYLPEYGWLSSGLLSSVDEYFRALPGRDEVSYLPSAPPDEVSDLPSAPTKEDLLSGTRTLSAMYSADQQFLNERNFRIPRSMESPSLPRHRASPLDPAAVHLL
jgi:hypothetical protein